MKTPWILALAVAGCAEVVGSGNVVTESRSTPEYRAVAVQSGLRARLLIGPQALSLRTDDNLIRFIETNVENGILTIRMQQNVPLAPKSFEALVTSPELASVSASGGAVIEGEATPAPTFSVLASGQSRVTLTGLAAQVLKVDASGASTVTLTGSAGTQTLKGSGASQLDTSDLQTTALEVDLSGASFAAARVTELVFGQLSGASHLRVIGAPAQRDVELTGGSSVDYSAP